MPSTISPSNCSTSRSSTDTSWYRCGSEGAGRQAAPTSMTASRTSGHSVTARRHDCSPSQHDDAIHYVKRRTTVGRGATLGRVPEPEPVLRSAYQAFNDRDIETALELLHPDVDWPNAWEGGRVRGRAAVREYWARQFAAISSEVQPERFTSEPDGSVTVDVHQVARDARTHELLSDAHVRHRYRLETGLILRMDVLPA